MTEFKTKYSLREAAQFSPYSIASKGAKEHADNLGRYGVKIATRSAVLHEMREVLERWRGVVQSDVYTEEAKDFGDWLDEIGEGIDTFNYFGLLGFNRGEVVDVVCSLLREKEYISPIDHSLHWLSHCHSWHKISQWAAECDGDDMMAELIVSDIIAQLDAQEDGE